MEGKTDPQAAAQEAYEEAGLEGRISDTALGRFGYKKAAKDGVSATMLSVTVYLMHVERQLAYWPEAKQRTMAWLSIESALDLVSNKSLAKLLRRVDVKGQE